MEAYLWRCAVLNFIHSQLLPITVICIFIKNNVKVNITDTKSLLLPQSQTYSYVRT